VAAIDCETEVSRTSAKLSGGSARAGTPATPESAGTDWSGAQCFSHKAGLCACAGAMAISAQCDMARTGGGVPTSFAHANAATATCCRAASIIWSRSRTSAATWGSSGAGDDYASALAGDCLTAGETFFSPGFADFLRGG